jgi:hypothetical protein
MVTPITQEAQGIDSSRQEREENEEKMEIAAEGDQELKVVPENEKEQDKEEAIIETTEKPKISSSPSRTPTKRSSKSNNSQLHTRQKTKQHEGSKEGKTTIPLSSLSKHLDKQNTQINKIMQILQPIQKQIKSTERQLELTKQVQSQIKQLQKQVSQVQKEIVITTKNTNKKKIKNK